MNIDSVSTIEAPAWVLPTFAALFVAAVILFGTSVTAEKRKDVIKRAAAAVLCVGK